MEYPGRRRYQQPHKGESDMQYFDWNGTQVTWRNHGETVVLEPWGPDSLRVRAVLMGEV